MGLCETCTLHIGLEAFKQKLLDALPSLFFERTAASEQEGATLSARNRFTGLVTRVVADGVMAQVELQAGPYRVVSLISAEATRELGLEPGALAVAAIKATNVVIERP